MHFIYVVTNRTTNKVYVGQTSQQQVVDMYRRRGLRVYQVAEGNF